MYILKGFIGYAPFVDNSPHEVARFGELSSHSATYAKDKTYYTSEQTPGTTLISFHSVRDDSRADVPVEVRTTALKLATYIIDRARAGTTSSDKTALWQMVTNEFATTVGEFSLGEMLNDGGIYLPERITFRALELAEDNQITVWFSDERFRVQYDEYEIVVVPPLLPLDRFFENPHQLRETLDAYNVVAKLNEVQDSRGEYPYTSIQAQQYRYHSPANTEWDRPTYWIVLIYGQAGNNPDLIKNTLVEYILGNSEHSQEEWAEILPDLFHTTEFIITPLYMQYAIPNRELQAGIYSPFIDHRKILPLLQATAQGLGYTDAYVANEFETGSMLYKSLAFGAVGNPDNREGLIRLSKAFPDYLVVNNASGDFNRMEPKTQEWVSMFMALLKAAEADQPNSTVPLGMARITRGGVIYLAQVFDHITYLVVAKRSVEALAVDLDLGGF